jgi:hypothetical protein
MQRWTTSYRFAWTPIVTFARRQLRLLDWIEENLEPVAFYDRGEGTTGIALLSRDIRLTVDRNSMILEDGAVIDAGVSVLREAVAGVLQTFEPQSLKLTSASMAWSNGLDGMPYNEARAGLSRRISGIDLSEDDVPVPVDVSALMDVLTPDYRGQVEWGIVSADELVERLSHPPMGRIASNRPRVAQTTVDAEDLPESSLFIDTTFWPLNAPTITDVKGIDSAVEDVTKVSKRLATALYDQVRDSLGGTK